MLVHGGNYEKGVVDFSVNVNPMVSEDKMKRLLGDNVQSAFTYPEIDGKSLEKMIEERMAIKEGCVYVGNGASDCLYQVAGVLKPNTVLIIEPTFTEYKRAFEQYGSTVLALYFDTLKDQVTMEGMILEQIKKIKGDMVVLCNPNNPTGHCYSKEFVESLVKVQKAHKGYVLVDESFVFFDNIESFYHPDWWNLIVLTSLTKYYGIPGLRIGYVTSNVSLIQSMKKVQVPWSVNGLAIECTKALMNDDEHMEVTRQWYENEKAYVFEELSKVDYLEPLPSNGNYFLCRLKGVQGTRINAYLLDQKVPMAVRTCLDFKGLEDDYIRIGLKEHEQNKILMEALKAFSNELVD